MSNHYSPSSSVLGMPQVWFVVPAAGIGQRMRADRPKQYLSIDDTTILEHTLAVLLRVNSVAGIVVAIHPDDTYWSDLPVAQHEKIHTVVGGDERCDSVMAALTYLGDRVVEQDWVLVHDAARPCVRTDTIGRMMTELQNDKVGGILGVKSSDTLKQVNAQGAIQKTVDRSCVWQAQTPQMFRYGILRASLTQAIANADTITDEASAVEKKGYSVRMVEGCTDNIKITHPDDLWLAEAILTRQQYHEHSSINR